MLDIQFIASLKKRFSRKHTSIEQLDDIQKQQSVEEQVPSAQAVIEQEQPLSKEEQVLTKWDPIEQELLAQRGFTPEEVLALLWLRHRYQHGGSDRLIIVRRLEFLRHLVMNGTLEL